MEMFIVIEDNDDNMFMMTVFNSLDKAKKAYDEIKLSNYVNYRLLGKIKEGHTFGVDGATGSYDDYYGIDEIEVENRGREDDGSESVKKIMNFRNFIFG